MLKPKARYQPAPRPSRRENPALRFRRMSVFPRPRPFSVIAAARLNGLPSRYRGPLAALVRWYSAELGFEIGVHAQRATPTKSALDHQGDIAKVQEWLGHAQLGTGWGVQQAAQ